MKDRRETVYNFFLFIEEANLSAAIITEVGVVTHKCGGTDDTKMTFLQNVVHEDVIKAKRYPLPDWCILVLDGGKPEKRKISYETFKKLSQLRKMMIVEHIFKDLGGCHNPIMVMTCVVDGKIKIDRVGDI